MNRTYEVMTFGDLFAGGGGTTTGALMNNNVDVLWALNHSKEAIYTHELNHPETEHFRADIRNMDEKKCCPVDALWASLECTNFSNAKGGQSRDADSRTLAWELPRFIRQCKPKYIMIENVREFMDWGPLRIKEDKKNSDNNYCALSFDKKGRYIFIPIEERKGEDYSKWVSYIKSMGFVNYDKKILNSADYGAHTSRNRLFIVFGKENYPAVFPTQSHHKKGLNGLQIWKSCKELIDLDHHGNSIFGREKPLVENTLKRIAGGIKKYAPEFMKFIMKYYGNGDNVSSINEPLHTIPTKDPHALITFDNSQFISEYYGRDNANKSLDEPMSVITTLNQKTLVTLEKKQFISKYYSGNQHHASSLDEPLHTITTVDHNTLVSVDYQFLSSQYNSGGKPESNNKTIDQPLNAIMTRQKHQFITLLTNKNIKNNMDPELDFDIKIRFLTPDELGKITGFPESYIWFGSKRFQTWMIGNAVPCLMAKAIINRVKDEFLDKVIEFKEVG